MRSEPPEFREWIRNGYRMVSSLTPSPPAWLRWLIGLLYTGFLTIVVAIYAEEISALIPGLGPVASWIGDIVLGFPMLILLFAWVIYRQRKIRRELTEIRESVNSLRTDGGENGSDVWVVLFLGGLAGAAAGTYFGDGVEVLAGALLGAYLLYIYDQSQ